MALHPPVLSSPKLCARQKRCISYKDRAKQHIPICKTSPLTKKKAPKQPLDERSLSKLPLNERSKYADKCRCHKQRHHRTHSKCPQRWSEDEILPTISREKPRLTAQYFREPKRWSFKRQWSPCKTTRNGPCLGAGSRHRV